MTVVPMPEVANSLGNKVLVALTTPPAADEPTLTEINAGVFITCHVYDSFNPEVSQNTGEGPRKLCKKSVPTKLGQVTYAINDIQYSYAPQNMGTPGGDGNEAIEALTPGSEVYLVEAVGVNGETAQLAAGDVVNVYHVVCGEQRRGQTGDGEFDEFSVTQSFVMANGEEPQYDVVLSA